MQLADMKNAVKKMGMEDLKNLYEILKVRADTLQREAVQLFSVGDNVYFIYQGNKVFGVVKKINQKSIKVDCRDERNLDFKYHTTCNVGVNLLRKETALV